MATPKKPARKPSSAAIKAAAKDRKGVTTRLAARRKARKTGM